ncbi:hypothetical protein EVA_12479 [gut metagenome]|uniref:Uncharacterized protein n=1 Tax=gut metagenome TaxID=749906 RepID=J9GIP9_9ZZZZ
MLSAFPSVPKPRRTSPTILPKKKRSSCTKWASRPPALITLSRQATICWVSSAT